MPSSDKMAHELAQLDHDIQATQMEIDRSRNSLANAINPSPKHVQLQEENIAYFKRQLSALRDRRKKLLTELLPEVERVKT